VRRLKIQIVKRTHSIEVFEYEKNIAGSIRVQKLPMSKYCCFLVKRFDERAHPVKRAQTIVRKTEKRIGPQKLH